MKIETKFNIGDIIDCPADKAVRINRIEVTTAGVYYHGYRNRGAGSTTVIHEGNAILSPSTAPGYLFAYMVNSEHGYQGSGEIRFFEREIETNWLKRAPQYDRKPQT